MQFVSFWFFAFTLVTPNLIESNGLAKRKNNEGTNKANGLVCLTASGFHGSSYLAFIINISKRNDQEMVASYLSGASIAAYFVTYNNKEFMSLKTAVKEWHPFIISPRLFRQFAGLTSNASASSFFPVLSSLFRFLLNYCYRIYFRRRQIYPFPLSDMRYLHIPLITTDR